MVLQMQSREQTWAEATTADEGFSSYFWVSPVTRGDSAAAASDDEFERSARTLFTMSAIGASPMMGFLKLFQNDFLVIYLFFS